MKNWIKKKWYWICFCGILTVFAWGLAACGNVDENADPSEWEKRSSTVVMSQTYLDTEGNKMIYYCCKTTYYGEDSAILAEPLDRNALSMVVNKTEIEKGRECKVGDWPAVLCQYDDRSYLCWTISPEYSCIIEYDADIVSDEDIFRMAESVVRR